MRRSKRHVPFNYARKRENARDERAWEWQQKKFKVIHSAFWLGGMVKVGTYKVSEPDRRKLNDFGKPMGTITLPKSLSV